MSTETATTRSRLRTGAEGFRDALVPGTPTGRVLAYCATVDSLTIGLFLAATTLYFVSMLGITAVSIGAALAVANIAGLIVPVPMGAIADRFGARPVYIWLMVVRAAGFLGYIFVSDVIGYLVLTSLISGATRSCLPLLQVVVGEVEASPARTRTMASMRAFNNIGLTAGFLISGLAQATHSPAAFQVSFGVNALALLSVGGAMLVVGRLVSATSVPATRAEPAADGHGPLRDPRYLVVTAGNAVMMLHDSILFILLPLWLVQRGLPGVVSSALFAVNTVLTILLQITVSRYAHGAANALRLLRWGCATLFAACGLFAVADTDDRVMAVVLVVLAVVTLTVGENLHAIAGWEMSYVMAPEGARGRYLSLFSAGTSTQLIFGPFLMTALILPAATLGWVIMAALFAVATSAMALSVRPFAARATKEEF